MSEPGERDAQNPQTQRRRHDVRNFCAVLAAVLVGCVLWFYWPLINPRWAQDRCEFGSVSNQKYREMLSSFRPKAEAVLREIDQHEYTLIPPGNSISPLLTSYFAETIIDDGSDDLKIASMHAAARALGAWHHRTDPGPGYVEATYGVYSHGIVQGSRKSCWSYRANIIPFCLIGRLFPWADIDVFINEKGGGGLASFRIAIFKEQTFDYVPSSFRHESTDCPSMPPG